MNVKFINSGAREIELLRDMIGDLRESLHEMETAILVAYRQLCRDGLVPLSEEFLKEAYNRHALRFGYCDSIEQIDTAINQMPPHVSVGSASVKYIRD